MSTLRLPMGHSLKVVDAPLQIDSQFSDLR